jgi:ferritin-like metal-binding protein YciE
MADDKALDTVQQYVGDMLALETQIEEAIDRQLKAVAPHPRAAEAVKRFHDLAKGQRDALKAHLRFLGGSESSPLKSAVAGIAGAAAGMVEQARTEKVAKILRDDYVVFNEAAIGYAMLHATAHALGRMDTMELADRHLRAYARAAQEINQLIADVVVWELREDGHTVDEAAIQHCTMAINDAWRDTSPSHEVTGGTTGTRTVA